MKLRLFVLCCIIQSIRGSDNSEYPSRRIVDGYDAPDDLAPYQCSVHSIVEYLCGCSVINPNYVLTAAHCFSSLNSNDVRIMVGTNDLRIRGPRYRAERLIRHEDYNATQHINDIALVKVNRPIEFTNKVEAIELEDNEVRDGTEVRLTGWGKLSANASQTPDKLQFINLSVLAMNRCKKTNLGADVDDNSQICTNGQRGKGACQYDSGGPLVDVTSKKLVGVLNFGTSKCAIGEPDVYAKVAYYFDWITKHSSNQND